MSRKKIHVPKDLPTRMAELIKSLYVLRDSIDAVRQGADHQLIPLYGQLRALLTDRSPESPPLLLDMADELEHDLEFFVTEPVVQADKDSDQNDGASNGKDLPSEQSISQEDLLFAMGGFFVTNQKQFPNQVLMSVRDFVDQPILSFRNETYTVREIINHFANRAGGAHYSTRLKKDLADALQIGLGGQPTLDAAMVQIGEAALVAGRQLLRQIAEFDLHLGLYLWEHDDDEESSVLDSRYTGSPMRLSVSVAPNGRLRFMVVGIDGTSSQVMSSRIIDWEKPHDFAFRLRITDALFTRLEILVEGEKCGETTLNKVIFIPADPLHYNTYINRSGEQEGSSLTLCMAYLALFRGFEVSPYEEAERLVHFKDQAEADRQCVFISKSTYGCIPAGTMDMEFHPESVMWSYAKLQEGKTPEPE